MVVLQMRNTGFSIKVSVNHGSKSYFTECFIKQKTQVRFGVFTNPYWPTNSEILTRTRTLNCRSPRPFFLGQDIDGSTKAPVIHLFNQFCGKHLLNTIELFHKVYETEVSEEELQDCLEFAEWQGVEQVNYWSESRVKILLESLKGINLLSL